MTNEEASFILANIDRRVCDDELSDALDMAIKALEQQPKTGRWIDIQYFKADDTYYRPKCPFCSIEPKEYSNYCPNCGARMEEAEE